MGFSHVQASPLTRSSYHAREAVEATASRDDRRSDVRGRTGPADAVTGP